MFLSQLKTHPHTPRSHHLTLSAQRALEPVLLALDHPATRDILIQVRSDCGEMWLDLGEKLKKIPGWTCSSAAVHAFAREIISAGGRHLDESTPIADVRLGAGIRVHAVLPPVSVHGATVSIRVPSSSYLSFDALVGRDLCSENVANVLKNAVRSRKNILITGGTGTGKTTLLSALLGLANEAERIVTIEDVAELTLAHPNHVALEARQRNTEGVGEVSLNELLRATLRMRPDRIVLGECRGAEIATLLNAFNTGHAGGAGTLHANGLTEVVARLEVLGALGGISAQALAKQVVSAIHLVVHLVRDPQGNHRVSEIGMPALSGKSLIIQRL